MSAGPVEGERRRDRLSLPRRQVGEQPAERRRELEAVPGAQADDDRRMPGHPVHHEVAVGRQRVLAAQRPHRRSRPGQHPAHVPGQQREHVGRRAPCRARPGRPPGRRSPAPPSWWARRSRGSRRTTARPSRSTAASGPARTAPGPPARSTSPAPASPSAGSRARAARAARWSRRRRRPRRSAGVRRVRRRGPRPRRRRGRGAGDRRPVAQHRAVTAASACISGGAGTGGHDRAALLVQPDGAVRQRELRPPGTRSRRTSSSSKSDADLGRARRCSRRSGSPGRAGTGRARRPR